MNRYIMLIYDSGKYILDYIYSLYNYIFNSSKYYYDLLFSNDYKYECLNMENDPSTHNNIFISENVCGICICTQYEIPPSNTNIIIHSNYITHVNSNGQIEANHIKFTDLSNSWKCLVCNNFNSLSINTCNDCLIDPSYVPFLHEVVNEMSNHIDIDNSSLTTHLLKEIIDELIDIIVEENEKSNIKDESISLLSSLQSSLLSSLQSSLPSSLQSDWECL